MATIFVYGTLLEGCRNYDRLLKGRVRSIQTAYVKGTLYSLKGVDYPALVDGDSFIRGEQMEVADDVLPLLDELEGLSLIHILLLTAIEMCKLYRYKKDDLLFRKSSVSNVIRRFVSFSAHRESSSLPSASSY